MFQQRILCLDSPPPKKKFLATCLTSIRYVCQYVIIANLEDCQESEQVTNYHYIHRVHVIIIILLQPKNA